MKIKLHDHLTSGITEIIIKHCEKFPALNKRNISILSTQLKAYITEQADLMPADELEFLLFSFIPEISRLHQAVTGSLGLYCMLEVFELWTCNFTTALILAA